MQNHSAWKNLGYCIFIGLVVGFALPAVAADLSVDVDTTLAEDTDWRSYDSVTVASGITLDLGGYKLYVKSIAGSGTVTDTSGGAELHVDVGSGATVTISSLALTGSLRLVKDGAGLLVAQKYPQTYSGGTDVVQGSVRYGCSSKNVNSTSGASPFGTVMTIDVRSGAIFDPYGGYNWGNHTFNLHGGVISNTVAAAYGTNKNGMNGTINLHADSGFATTLDYVLRGTIRLNGYTLGIRIASGKYLDFAPASMPGSGTLKLIAGGWVRNQVGAVDISGIKLVQQGAALNLSKAISVGDYECSYSQNYGKSSGGMNVYGTFTPVNNYFYGCKLQDGSAIDLSRRAAAWSTTSSITDSTMTKTVSFADPAVVTIALGDREVAAGEKLIAWTSKPNAVFRFNGKYSIVKPVVRADGVYMGADDADFIVAPIPDQVLERGGTLTPSVVVSNLLTGAELTEGVDYTLSYPDSALGWAFGGRRAVATGIGGCDGKSSTRSFAVVEPSPLKMLPAEYRQVEYIQGDGTAARIVTSYTPNPSIDRIEMRLMPTDRGRGLFCSRGTTSGTASWTTFWWNPLECFYFHYYNVTAAADVSFAAGEIDVDQEYLLVAASNVCAVSNCSVSASKVHSPVADFTAAGGPVTLFATYYNGTGSNLANYSAHRLYSFTVYRSNKLFRDFVPCVRRSDSMPGLYERVTGAFIARAESTGSFTAGPARAGLQVLPIACQPYSGSAVTPAVSVIDMETGAAVPPSSFSVAYSDNVAPGSIATVTVSGRVGTAYEGYSAEANFTVAYSYRVTAYSLAAEGDGLTWESPMSLTNAIATAAAGEIIMLKSGEYVVPAIVTFPKAVTVLGGYAGTAGDALDPTFPLSVFTQAAASNLQYILGVTASSGTFSMERVQVQEGRQYGMVKSNAACNLYVSGCNFVSNGFSYLSTKAATYYGKGLRVNGSSSSEVVVTNCYFAYNCQTNNDVKTSGGPSAAFYVAASKRTLVVDTKFHGNCAFLGPSGKGSSNTNLYDLYPQGSAIYAPSPIHLLRCDFRANVSHIRSSTALSGGTVWFASGSQGSVVEDCIFAGNLDRCANGATAGQIGGPIVLNLGSSAQKVTIIGSTFACNYADTTQGAGAMTVNNGTAEIKNCVFYGNKMRTGATNKAADIKVTANGVVNISYSVLGGDKTNQVFCADGGTYDEGNGMVYSDPLLVTSADDIMGMIRGTTVGSYTYYAFPRNKATYDALYGIDVHLLSKAGYVTNGAETVWLEADVSSPAIDAGDPLDDYSLEPDPNGSRRNAGVYGNTPQASKTLQASSPVEFSGIEVDYPSGYSNPRLNFSLDGEDGVFVDVTVSCTMEDGRAFSSLLAGCATGGSYSYVFPDFYETGTNIAYVLSGVSSSATVTPSGGSFEVTEDLPPWWGHGGGEGVMHVWSGALGDGSGRDWHNACRSWNELVAVYAASSTKPSEIWFIDLAAAISAANTLAVTSALTMRGGFTYLCDSIDDRADGARSVLSARNSYTGLVTFNNASAKVEVERLDFTRSTTSGLAKTGAGNLEVRDCSFYWNGNSGNAVNGRGLSVAGTAGTTLVSVSNCVFAGNGMFTAGGYNFGYGGGAYFANLKRVFLDNCSFVTNGAMRSGSSYPTANYGGDKVQGSALCLSGAPLTARNCAFLANHGTTRDNTHDSGGALRFAGNCNGSVMSNCVVSGCSDRIGWSGQPGYHGGAIVVTMDSTSRTLDLVNVTIAYNVADGIACPGGINLYTGTVNLRNSIVFGNYSSKNSSAGNRFGADVDVKATGVLNAEYTLFTEDSTNSISHAEGATVGLGPGVIYGDPLFVTTKSGVDSMVASSSGSEKFVYFNTMPANLVPLTMFNVHLRGRAGYVDETRGVRVCAYGAQSRAIDAGDPAADFSREPEKSWGYSGRRVNLGYYGNTPYATATPYRGTVIYIGSGGARVERPAPPDEPPTETIGGGGSSKPLGIEDIIVCDQADQAIKIYRGTEVVWRWAGAEDTTIPSGDRSGFGNNVAECKIVKDGTAVAMAANGGRWAVVGLAATNVLAWGKSSGWPHSIELLPNDIVAVAATDTSTPANKGVYLYDASGARAKSPNSQNRTQFAMDNPHGLYWDAVTQRLFVSDTQGLHKCRVGYDGTTFSFEVEQTWLIAPLGLTYAHDLMPVPGSRLLAMTTYEQIVFFDIDTLDWRRDLAIWRADAKCFDPHRDGVHFLVTVPKAGFSPTWCTDTIETYSADEGFMRYLVIPGSKLYKARWARK